ncbi:MAG TPA: capsid cement protein, partial [Acidimicrobiia bacterium]
MAYEFSNAAVKVTRVAGEDLSGSHYKFVKLDNGDGTVKAVDGATDRPFGVLQNDPTSGQAAEVCIVGGTKVQAGGSASVGQPLFANASANAVTLGVGTTGSAAYLVGTFVEDAASGAITT